MINVEKYENIDYLASKKILELIIILAVSDDNLHISERKFIFDLATKLNIKKEEAELILDKIIEIQKNNKNYLWSLTDELVEYFYDNELRYLILETLSNLAKQDLIMHKNEISFLKIVSKKWKIKAVFSENISWDSTQKKIINSNFNERIAVSAGPGTGKTAIACARVSSIVDEGLPSSSIMMLSFTRTAIRELSDRIANFISSDNNPSNLRITTIDSQAWSILYGFSDEEVENLFGSFDANIEESIRKIKSNDRKFLDYLESLRHIVIDEAQDILGIRAELIETIINKLSPECGVTIFYDKAQAIYGFSSRDEVNKKNLMEILENKINNKEFEKFELKQIYRTDSKNLQTLFTSLRYGIFGYQNFSNEQIDTTISHISKYSDYSINLPKRSEGSKKLNIAIKKYLESFKDGSGLFLFRSRAEVLVASSSALQEGIRHRIRTGNLPKNILQPVIGLVFSEYTEDIIEENEFKRLTKEVYEKNDYLKFEVREFDFIENIFFHFKKKNVVLLKKMKKHLSRSTPNIDFTYIDYGHSGPVIGTIHASKGREADNVILMMSAKKTSDDQAEIKEEINLNYVGATRAKKKLSTGLSVDSVYAKKTKGDRVYISGNKGASAQFEVGKLGDFDEFSIVDRKNFKHEDHANSLQKYLIGNFLDASPVEIRIIKSKEDGWKYKLEIPEISLIKKKKMNKGLFMGFMSSRFNKDLQNIKYKTPFIFNSYIVGVRTYCAKINDPRLEYCSYPYNQSGMWLVPIVRGFEWARFQY
jgi:hypothetical protein